MCVNAWYETSFILIYNNPLDIMLWFCTAEAILLNIVLVLKENLFMYYERETEREIAKEMKLGRLQ